MKICVNCIVTYICTGRFKTTGKYLNNRFFGSTFWDKQSFTKMRWGYIFFFNYKRKVDIKVIRENRKILECFEESVKIVFDTSETSCTYTSLIAFVSSVVIKYIYIFASGSM